MSSKELRHGLEGGKLDSGGESQTAHCKPDERGTPPQGLELAPTRGRRKSKVPQVNGTSGTHGQFR